MVGRLPSRPRITLTFSRVSYDDDETIAVKENYANQNCMGGTMVWALDLADPKNDTSSTNLIAQGMPGIDGRQALSSKVYAAQKFRAVTQQDSVTLQVFWTDCAINPTCPAGCT